MTMRATMIAFAVWVTLAAVLVAAAAVHGAPAQGAITPHDAVARAVAERLRGNAGVAVAALQTTVAPEPWLRALPEPGGRLGQPMRFVLMAGRLRRGIAVATVSVHGPHARAARAIARGSVLAPEDIQVVDGEWPPIALERVPGPDGVVGLTARRDITAGEMLTPAVLTVPPIVRSGDIVTVTATVGAVQVTGSATASGSGHEGDVVRVVLRPQGRPVKGRITAAGAVEVVP